MNCYIEALIKVFLLSNNFNNPPVFAYFDNDNREILIMENKVWHYRRDKMASAFILVENE